MYKLWCTLVLGVLVLAFQAYANPSADDAQDDSVDSVAAAAIYAGDLLGSDAMGMTSKRSLDLFPRTNCGYGRFYCPRKWPRFLFCYLKPSCNYQSLIVLLLH